MTSANSSQNIASASHLSPQPCDLAPCNQEALGSIFANTVSKREHRAVSLINMFKINDALVFHLVSACMVMLRGAAASFLQDVRDGCREGGTC